MKTKANSVGGISDTAVAKATGKTWNQWVTLLDKAGCRKMNHKEIVAVVQKKYGIGPWWRQMVTVGYEQAVGLRMKHEVATGFQISRSKTLNVPLATLYRAWFDAKARSQWLSDADFTIRKAAANKSLRITWVDGKTNVEVLFYKKGTTKSLVTVQHNKLPSAAAGEKMKRYWGMALNRLQKVLA